MALVGYARVSTEDQATARQLDDLRAVGCREVAEENASGGDRNRSVLARSLSHLLNVVESLQVGGKSPLPASKGSSGSWPLTGYPRGRGIWTGPVPLRLAVAFGRGPARHRVWHLGGIRPEGHRGGRRCGIWAGSPPFPGL
jgi:hypothetical protein